MNNTLKTILFSLVYFIYCIVIGFLISGGILYILGIFQIIVTGFFFGWLIGIAAGIFVVVTGNLLILKHMY